MNDIDATDCVACVLLIFSCAHSSLGCSMNRRGVSMLTHRTKRQETSALTSSRLICKGCRPNCPTMLAVDALFRVCCVAEFFQASSWLDLLQLNNAGEQTIKKINSCAIVTPFRGMRKGVCWLAGSRVARQFLLQQLPTSRQLDGYGASKVWLAVSAPEGDHFTAPAEQRCRRTSTKVFR
jgi:hypothetical protein